MTTKMIAVCFMLLFMAVSQAHKYNGCPMDDGKCDHSCPNDKMKNLMPPSCFDEKEFLGTWYSARWYLPSHFTVEVDEWSYTHTFYIKEDTPNVIFFDINAREKGAAFCLDTRTSNMTRIRPGQYHMPINPWGDTYVSTVLWMDKNFLLEIYCYENWGTEKCENQMIMFWYRTPTKPAQKYFDIGEEILRNLCYPHMGRFIDDYVTHGIDDNKKKMDCGCL